MSGHSKWKNIMHKKEKTDAQRAKIFTKIGREMSVCVKEGGPDPVSNGKLRDLIAKAKANNVPNENIERIIKKAAGGERDEYESIIYEGYGPSGVAVIAEALTDNRNRTAGDVRHYFDKYGGNLGATGCVGWMFKSQGIIVISGDGVSEDALMEDALNAGAEDIKSEDGVFEVITSVNDLIAVEDALRSKGYSVLSADEDRIPDTYVTLTDENAVKNMSKLLEMLEDNDDILNVYHNWENCGDGDEDED